MQSDRGIALALRRLLPLLVLMYAISYLDRINLTFAQDQLARDLALSDSAFGLAAGIFFLGYALFEVPSNLLLVRFGPRIWLGRIMITWGVLAAANALAWDAASLSVLRFLLGIGEAGFFPGAIYLLSQWFPNDERGRATGVFFSGVAIAAIVGGPLSGALLELDGVAGLAGWRWMFLGEGLPAVLVGLYALRALPGRPSEARWMPAEEAQALERRVSAEATALQARAPLALREVFTDRRTLLLAAAYPCMTAAASGVTFWLADIIERAGEMSDVSVGLIAAIPFTFGAAGLLVIGAAADRATDRKRAVAAGMTVGVLSLIATAVLPPVLAIAPLCVATFVGLGGLAAFWTLPTALLSGRAAAAGIALVSSVGQLGGLLGPVLVGALKDSSGSLTPGLLALAGCLAVGTALIARVRMPRTACAVGV